MQANLDTKFQCILDDVDYLKANDAVFSRHFPSDYQVKRARGAADMAALIRIIIGQQISNAVANTLWLKLTNAIDPNEPDAYLLAEDEQLRSFGLSRQKIKYARGVAQAVKDQTIDIATWIEKDDATVIAEITALKGFGPWSAQMFMMFHLCHRHIWPAGDLGLQLGLQKYLDAPEKPNETETLALKSQFEGRETAAAFLLWALKGDDLP